MVLVSAFLFPRGKSQLDVIPSDVAAFLRGEAEKDPSRRILVNRDFLKNVLMQEAQDRADENREKSRAAANCSF